MSDNAIVPLKIYKKEKEKKYSIKETLTFSLLSFILGCLLTSLVLVIVFSYLYVKLDTVSITSFAQHIIQDKQQAYYTQTQKTQKQTQQVYTQQVQKIPEEYIQHTEVPSHTNIEVYNTDTTPIIDNPIFPPIPEAPKKEKSIHRVKNVSPPPTSFQYIAPNYNTPSDVHLGVE